MPGSGLPSADGTRRLTAGEELIDKLTRAAETWGVQRDEAPDSDAAALADARAVSYEHAVELARTLLGPKHVDGARVACRGCGRVVTLPFTDEQHVWVSLASLDGWATAPPRCPACVERGR